MSYLERDGEPEHARVVLHFDDGYRLAYDCRRKLGEVEVERLEVSGRSACLCPACQPTH